MFFIREYLRFTNRGSFSIRKFYVLQIEKKSLFFRIRNFFAHVFVKSLGILFQVSAFGLLRDYVLFLLDMQRNLMSM